MTKLSDRILSNQEHMNRVRAVHRRSAYERVLSKIATLQADGGVINDNEREQLTRLLDLRDVIRAELVENGQLES